MVSKTIALIITASAQLNNQGKAQTLPENVQTKPFWKSEAFLNETPEQQAQEILDKMNFSMKASMVRGRGSDVLGGSGVYTGHTIAIPEVGIPQLNCNDGPQGFRQNENPGTSTQFPSGQAVSASWDEEVIYKWGAAMGKEFYDKGAQIQLGPGLNVARLPKGGRNFEYLSGEDPFLGYVLTKQAVWGIQNQTVMANAKHYVNNNQETNRLTIDENVDERTRFEMYYPPFEGAIEAGVGSFMCSYNKINGIYSCENNSTLNTDLRDRLGFKGYVMSDWGATHSVSIAQGLDQEQPANPPIMTEEALKDVDEALLNQTVYRILYASAATGILQSPSVQTGSIDTNVTSSYSKMIARELAEESAVLLSNKDNTLPMDFHSKYKSILIVGQDDITNSPITGGGGSGRVDASYIQTPVNELAVRLGVQTFVSKDNEVQRHCDATDTRCVIYAGGDCHDPSCIPSNWEWDATIIFVGQNTGEDHDRDTLAFTDETQEMVSSFNNNGQQNGRKTVVVISSPGMTLLPWANKVDAQIMNFYAGEQMSQAIFNIIEGVTVPSGKLPVTLPNKENEQQMSELQFPGINLESNYTEKLLFGYRWYDKYNVTPKYPFGHGLSYTTFAYHSDIHMVLNSTTTTIAINVTNSGDVTGKEVVQLYVGFPQAQEDGEPLKSLKGFKKIELQPGTTTTVEFTLRDRDLSNWDADAHKWVLQTGDFSINVGSSSRDIRATATLTVPDSSGDSKDEMKMIYLENVSDKDFDIIQ